MAETIFAAGMDEIPDELDLRLKQRYFGAMKYSHMPRPDWDTYFMDIAHVVKSRGNCMRRQVAAVIVKERRIISTGYNGTPSGIRNCFEGGCPRCASTVRSGKNLGECICAHAEENAIIQAAHYGVGLRDAVLYCTESPCLLCAKMIISAGIKKVIYESEYHYSRQVASLFRQGGVACRKFVRKNKGNEAR